MVDPRPGRHAAHDPLLVAAYAAGDAAGSRLARAAELVAICASCAGLHRDLRVIATALATAPAPARPRDFRLSSADAASLAGRRSWRHGFPSGHLGVRPIAGGLLALGIAAILIGGAVRLNPLGAAHSTTALVPATDRATLGPTAAMDEPSAAASAAPSSAAGSPSVASRGLIDLARAIAIARGCVPSESAAEPLRTARLRTFGELDGMIPVPETTNLAPDDPVWLVWLGRVDAPVAGGSVCAIDARTGEVLGAAPWAGGEESSAPVSS